MSVTTFRYSPAEIGALAAEIKLPGDIDKLHALANAEHVQGNRDLHEKLRSEMPRRVTLVLELCANGVLDGEHFVRRPRSRENLEIIDRIAKNAKRLRLDLSQKIYTTDFCLLFDTETFDVVQLLSRIEHNVELARTRATWLVDSDTFANRQIPALNEFVAEAVRVWEKWNGRTAGRGNGPAARFVLAAANPLLTFAEKKLGKSLRRAGLMDEADAGRMVAECGPEAV